VSRLRVERDQGVVTATLDRPERRNAIDPETWDALTELLAEVGRRAEDRVLVLTGAGGHFSSGGDLAGSGRPGESALDTMRRTVNAACLALHELPKPTLAAVPGLAAGAGANLALGCDLVIAARSARFAELFVDRALPLDSGGSWLLPRLVGPQRAKELAFFGDWIAAADAHDLGLVNRVVDDADLPGTALSWARRLADKSPGALAQIKRGLQTSFSTSFAEALEAEARALVEQVQTPEFEAVMARFAGSGRSQKTE